jgi:hypothetical protein
VFTKAAHVVICAPEKIIAKIPAFFIYAMNGAVVTLATIDEKDPILLIIDF